MMDQGPEPVTPALVDEAERLLKEASDQFIVPRFRNLAADEVKSKSSASDLVTVADTQAEAWLTPRLMDLLPGSVVVGEEAVAADAAIVSRLSGPAPAWVIDPVDGTRNFAEGRETFVCMIALVVGGEPLFGALWRPLKRELFWAAKGQGAWYRPEGEGRKQSQLSLAQRPPVARTEDMVGSISFKWMSETEQGQVRRNAKYFAKPRALGCAGEEYIALATGQKDFAHFALLNPWDHAPGLVLVREAGGVDVLGDGSAYTTDVRRGCLLVAPSHEMASKVRARLFASQ